MIDFEGLTTISLIRMILGNLSTCTIVADPPRMVQQQLQHEREGLIDLSLSGAQEGAHSAGCIADFAASFGTPTRSRRSDSEIVPPTAINTAPIQISNTMGL